MQTCRLCCRSSTLRSSIWPLFWQTFHRSISTLSPVTGQLSVNGETNGDSEKRYLQARATVIRLSGKDHLDPNSSDSFYEAEVLSDKLKKVDLCKRYNLQPRDLGALDVDIVGRRTQIFVRPGTIVYSADIRAIIRSDKMLLLEPKETTDEDTLGNEHEQQSEQSNQTVSKHRELESPGADERKLPVTIAHALISEMKRINVQDSLTLAEGSEETSPFEFIALEALLGQTTKRLFRTSHGLQTDYQDLMKSLKVSDQIPTSALQKMLELKDAIEEFKSRSEEFRQAVADVLREEADMAEMYLTESQAGKPRQIGEDDEVELLLEVYRHHAYSLTDLASTLLTRLQSITNHVTLLLSSTRNRLLNLEITIAFTTLGTSVGGLIGALFGMNLTSGLETTPYLFGGVSISVVILALIIIRWGRKALKNARSIKGEQQSLLQQPVPGLRRHPFLRH